tara:strand:+ start:40 stop:375 length:336 start_codon:yes stop_codon:yes gene_type:complete
MNKASNYNLDAMVADWAVEIFEQADDQDNATDLAHQYADGSEWVIYHHKAHQLCAACNTDMGEEFIADCCQSEGWTYNGFASAIAFGEIYGRLQDAINALYEIAEEIEEAA